MQLCAVYRMKVINRFDLQHDLSIDDHVEHVLCEEDSPVFDGNPQLPLYGVSPELELYCQRFIVDPLEKPRSQGSMHLDRCADDRERQLVDVFP